jgi:hypothetical protein
MGMPLYYEGAERRYPKMAETKYGKYILKEPIVPPGMGHHAEITAPVVQCVGEKEFNGAPFSINFDYITEPFTMISKAHAHDYDQFLFFLGGNPANMADFGAEVDLYLGEELELHIIKVTSVVHVPKGLIHGPLIYRKVERPIIFVDAFLAAGYVKSKVI